MFSKERNLFSSDGTEERARVHGGVALTCVGDAAVGPPPMGGAACRSRALAPVPRRLGPRSARPLVEQGCRQAGTFVPAAPVTVLCRF